LLNHWVSSKISSIKSQTSRLESKICKQATSCARPSPVITGISGVHSIFIWPFDLGSSQKKKETSSGLALPKTKEAVTIFPSINSIDAVDDSIECHLSIIPAYFIPV
jgi:hypothetical protein